MEPTISVATVLLPQSSVRVAFKISTSLGCFVWSCSSDVITLTPLYGDASPACRPDEASPFDAGRKDESCSIGVVVTTTGALVRERQTAMLTATDKTSGRVLRCEVFVDHIARLQIETTTRTLYKDDVEDVRVQAFDSEGNLFSTLDGLAFRWSILPLSLGRATNVMKFLPFRDVSVDAPASVYELEEQGKQSSQVLVQAMDVGRVNLTAVLEDAPEGHPLADSVVLSVYYPLLLEPSRAQYVLVGSSIQYVLQTQAKTGLMALPMPDPHYKWETSNTTVASVDGNGLVIARNLGRAQISAINMEMAGNRATGRLHVVYPAYVSLEVFLADGNSSDSAGTSSTHNLVVGRQYDMYCNLFEQGGHRLSHTSHLDWTVTLPPSWKVHHVAANHYRVIPNAGGTFTWSASLKSLVNQATNDVTVLETPLRAEQELFVTDPVKIGPSFALLPLDGVASDAAGQRFVVTGGSGRYNFYSSNRAVVTADAGGAVQPKAVGVAQVAAVDQTNLQNQDRATVEVAEPVAASLTRVQLEVRRGEDFFVPLEIRDVAGRSFTNCSSLRVVWTIEDAGLVSESYGSAAPSLADGEFWCTGKTFTAKELGRTVIRFSFGPTMNGEVVVRIYDPVAIEGPAAVCASVGTSIEVGWRGGPPPGDASSFYSRLVASSDASGVKIDRVELADGKSGFRVTCVKPHSQELLLRVGNSATKVNPKPAESIDKMRINCIAAPSRILLFPVAPSRSVAAASAAAAAATSGDTGILAAGQAQCSRVSAFASLESLLAGLSTSSGSSSSLARYQITNDEAVQLNVVVMDETGLVCSNFSSIPIAYETDQGSSVSVKAETSMPGAAVLSVAGFLGNVLVSAKAASAAPSQVEFNVVNALTVSQHDVFVFNRASDSTTFLEVTGGSGIYSIVLGDDSILPPVLVQAENPASVRIIPLRPGVASIVVRDVCISGKLPVHVRVRVADIKALASEYNRSFVPVGGSTVVSLRALSNFQEPLTNAQLRKYVRVEARHEDFIEVSVAADGVQWTATCLGVGSGSLFFVGSNLTGGEIQSPPIAVHCFPPLALFPKIMRLLPSELYQVRWSGCPAVSDLAFHVEDASIASVDSSGTITATSKSGKTALLASCRGIDPANGPSKIVFSSDSVELIVQGLGELRLRCPSNSLLVGAEMTIHAQGRSGETPITFGTQPLRYRWEAMNPEIASIVPVFGGSSGDEASFSVRVAGKNPGVTRISAWMTRGDDSTAEVALGSCQMAVTEPLTYVGGCNAIMLLPPQSRGHIRTSKDSTRTLVYRIVGASDTGVRVDEQGVVSTGSEMGSAFVEVSDASTGERLVVEVRCTALYMLQLLPETSQQQQQQQLQSQQSDGTLPIGSEVRVRLVLRAANGAAFHSADVAFEHEMNTYDIVSLRPGASNDTVILRAMRPGKAVLRVFVASNPSMEDFLLVTSGNAISPSQPLVVVGGTLHFEAFVAASGAPSVWSSLNPAIVSVEEATGKATALRPGRARIVLREGSVTTFTEVEVVRVDRVTVDKLDEPLSNVALLGSGKPTTVRAKVSFFSGGNTLRRSKGVEHNVLHSCQIAEHTWAFAIAQYDNVTDTHVCAITPLRPRNPKTQAPKTLTLEVKVGDVTTVAHLPFTTGFALVSEADESIELSVDKRSHFLEILASNAGQDQAPPLMVSASNPDKLEVVKVSETSSLYVFQLRVIDAHAPSFDVQVQLLSPLTGQKLTIPVSFKGPAVPAAAGSLFRPVGESSQQQAATPPPPKIVEVLEDATTTGGSSVFVLVMLAVLFGVILAALLAAWRYLAEPVVQQTAGPATPVRVGAGVTRSGFTPSRSWANKTGVSPSSMSRSQVGVADATTWIGSPNDTTRIMPSNASASNASAFESARRRR